MTWKHLDFTEPAVLRGIVTALLALAASLGFVIPADLSGAAQALVPTVAFVVPMAQALWTRARVSSPATVARIRAAGPQTPGVADHAA